MLRKLAEFDPESAQKLHPNDKKRIIRAIEVFTLTGKTISQHDFETKQLPPRYRARKIALTYSDRGKLYERINERVDTMISAGLLREVQTLLDMGLSPKSTAMQAIGYKELLGVISGEYSLLEAIEKIKMESRRYAKRQLSWLGRDESIEWIKRDADPPGVVFDRIFNPKGSII